MTKNNCKCLGLAKSVPIRANEGKKKTTFRECIDTVPYSPRLKLLYSVSSSPAQNVIRAKSYVEQPRLRTPFSNVTIMGWVRNARDGFGPLLIWIGPAMLITTYFESD